MKYMRPLSLYRDLLKPHVVEQGRLLGLNVRNKLVSLAISDSNNKIACPLRVLVRNKTDLGPMAVDFQHLNAELFVKALNVDPIEDKQVIGQFAAVSILQGYLDYINLDVKAEQDR